MYRRRVHEQRLKYFFSQQIGYTATANIYAGKFVTLRELVDEVGRDVVRFMMLTRKNDAPLDFDFDAAAEWDSNPRPLREWSLDSRVGSTAARGAG